MRILLTRVSAFGDIVHTWPLAELLHANAGQTRLGWVVEAPLVALVASHPAVARVFAVRTRRWRRRPFHPSTWHELAAVVAELRHFAPDLSLDPQGLIKSAVWGTLARAPRRFGLDLRVRRERIAGAFYTETVLATARHIVDINLALAAAAGIAATPGACPDGRFLLDPTAPPNPHPGVVLIPSTGGPGKTWPVAAFAELARRLAERGETIEIVWGPGEEPIAQAIAAESHGAAQVAGPTSIPELAARLGAASAVIGGDTGPIHLAAALGVATVALFLATDPDRNGPRGPRVRVLAGAQGRAARGRARTSATGSVTVEQVEDAIRSARGA